MFTNLELFIFQLRKTGKLYTYYTKREVISYKGRYKVSILILLYKVVVLNDLRLHLNFLNDGTAV